MEQSDPSTAPEAATDEPASAPAFPSEEARLFYLQGMNAGLRAAGRPAAHPHLPAHIDLDLTREGEATDLVSGRLFETWSAAPAPTGSANRHDGWSPEKDRLFLTTLAETGVVADACRAAGMSRNAAYARRRSAAGRAFALGWDAALLLSRAAVADDALSRSHHGVIDRLYRNGELVAERHRYDNRLTMAVLTRLDRLADGQEGRPEIHAVAGEFDRFLDLLPEGNEGAERFLAARFPVNCDGERREPGEAWSHEDQVPLVPGSERALLARLRTYEKTGSGLTEEVPTDDLDPAQMENWTDDQVARAEHGGLLGLLGREDWPVAISAPDDGADGSCHLRHLRRLFRLYWPAEEER